MRSRSDSSKYDVGSFPSVPHAFLSLRRHFRKGLPEGSRTLRAYVEVKWGTGKNNTTAYVVQIVDKPNYIIMAKARHTFDVLAATNHVV